MALHKLSKADLEEIVNTLKNVFAGVIHEEVRREADRLRAVVYREIDQAVIQPAIRDAIRDAIAERIRVEVKVVEEGND